MVRFIAKFKGARVPRDRAWAIILAPNAGIIRGGATTEGGHQPPSLWQNREPNGSRLRLTSRVRPSETDAIDIRRGADRTNRERRPARHAGAVCAAPRTSVSVRGASRSR